MKLYQCSGAETVQTEVFGIVACAVSFFGMYLLLQVKYCVIKIDI